MTSASFGHNSRGPIPSIPYNFFLPELHQIGSMTPLLREFSRFTGWNLEYHAAAAGASVARDGVRDGVSPERSRGLPNASANVSASTSPNVVVGPVPHEEELPHPLSAEMVQELTEAEDAWIPIHVAFSSASLRHDTSPTDEFSEEEKKLLREYFDDDCFSDARSESLMEQKLPILDHTAPNGFLHLYKTKVNPGCGNKKYPKEKAPTLPYQSVRKLAVTVADTLCEWLTTRLHLWRLEAEMVRCSPVFNRPHPPDEKHFASRFRLLLEYARQMLGVDAIGVYLMDGWGNHLKLRDSTGLSMDRLQKPPRKWKQLLPDVLAMQGDIVFYDGEEIRDWLPPEEDFAAGICLPLVTGHSQFGTVWFYSDTPHFFDQESIILNTEIFADHFALDLEREAAYLKQLMAEAYEDEMREAAKFQKNQLPIAACWIDKWDFSGWVNSARTVRGLSEIPDPIGGSRPKKRPGKRELHGKSVSGDFYDWFSVPGESGKIVFSLGSVGARGLGGACVASAVKTAVRAHAMYDLHADELLRSVNHTLWLQSAADGIISLCCGIIEEVGGQQIVRFAAAGTIDAFHFHGTDGCHVLNPPPTETVFDYIGSQADLNAMEEVLYLKKDDFLLLLSDGVSYGFPPSRREARKMALKHLLECRRKNSAGMIMTFTRNFILNRHELPPGKDHSILVVKKK